jgi:multidrug resistance efflux pump
MNARMMRIGAGLLVVGGALYVIVGEHFSGTSADAVINAQVVTMRAPIDGELQLAVHSLGARVNSQEKLATVSDPRPDDTRLLDLRRTAAQLQADLQRLKDRRAALETARAAYQKQADTYASGRLRQIEARIAEATSSMQAAQSRLRESDAAFRRSAELGKSGFQSQADLGRSRSAYEVVAQDVQSAEDRIRALTVELDVARQGAFLGDSNNDAPYSHQRIREISLQLAETDADLKENEQRLAATNRSIDEEEVRLGRFIEAQINAPVPGILWEVMASGGEYVRKAQDVMRIVDCTSTVVTASVRESVYNRLKVGDPAQFRLLGDPNVFDGTITRLAGSGAQSIYRSLAIGASDEHLKRFDVALVFPALKADSNRSCAIGRTGRVTFSAGPLQFWRRWLAEAGLI